VNTSRRNTFSKAERITKKKLVDQLFAGGNPSMAAFPLRAVYMPLAADDQCATVSILISVPKRRMRHAVDRNRIKRQIRQAYRTRKHALTQALDARDLRLAVAFVCIVNAPCTTPQVERSVGRILRRIQEQADKLKTPHAQPLAAASAP